MAENNVGEVPSQQTTQKKRKRKRKKPTSTAEGTAHDRTEPSKRLKSAVAEDKLAPPTVQVTNSDNGPKRGRKRKKGADGKAAAALGGTEMKQAAGAPSQARPTNQKLTASQRKNRYKRQRKKRPCWNCGKTGHSKHECTMPTRDGAAAPDSGPLCFGCRQPGHTLAACPSSVGNSASAASQRSTGRGRKRKAVVVCFNCGEPDHALRNCPKPISNGGTSFATCFVCSEKGHIASQCPTNTKGVFPKGGACYNCGSNLHRARDCREVCGVCSSPEHKSKHCPERETEPTEEPPQTGTKAKPRIKEVKF